jgi:hypothetical protein
MTQPKRPAEPAENREPDPLVRERVGERMRQMARLALLAATPLTNAACDPASPPHVPQLPTPTCERDPSIWVQFIRGQATWITEAGERIVLLSVTNPRDKPWLQAPRTYMVEGGTLLAPATNAPNGLRIKPAAGVRVIRLKGTASCHATTEAITITIDTNGTDEHPIVWIDLG